MPKRAELPITKDEKSGKWLLHISAKVSKTGKRSRLRFDTKAKAEKHRKSLISTLSSPRLQEFDETLLETANYYDEAFQLYGYKGLAGACAEWIKELDRKNQAQTLGQAIKEYKITQGKDWSDGYIQTFQWAKKQLEPLHDKLITQLDAHHWQIWLPKWRKKGDYAAKSFNHLRTFLISIYSTPLAVTAFPSNPIKTIRTATSKNKEVAISTNTETKKLLLRAWEEDPEMTPWFAIAFFAGLRPQSELGKLD